MDWPQFLEAATHQFKDDDVRLGYRIAGSGETRALSQLDCGYDWNTAMVRVREKAASARTRAVEMELRNMVSATLEIEMKRNSPWSQREPAVVPKGKKGKRPRSADVPPEPCPEARDQQKQYLKLQQKLRCTAHSTEGKTTYCLIVPGGEGVEGGHREMSHENMTLWAKLIVSRIYNTRRIKTHQSSLLAVPT
jgi:hypothetical protein